MKISVLGNGRWGSFIAWYSDKIGHEVLSWGLEDSPGYKQLKEQRKNDYVTFNERINISCNLDEALNFSDIIVISISSQNLRSFAREINKRQISRKTFILCMKGIELDTGKRLSEVMNEELDEGHKIAVWVGPGHVQDFVAGIPNAMVISSSDIEVTKYIVSVFSNDIIRFYYGEDQIGVEVGAAAKNVIGIAAGMLDGLGFSSLKGALMARGAREISKLIAAMGGSELTAYGLSHLGDYEATLFSQHSHNRRFGESFVKGEKFEKLAEGVYTVKALLKLSAIYKVDLPISEMVSEVLYNNGDPKENLFRLFLRPLKAEF